MNEKNHTNKDKNNKGTQSSIITKESIFAVGALFCAAALFCLLTDALIFGDIGEAVHDFLLGVFGYSAYLVFAAGVYIFGTSLFEVQLIKNRKAATCITLSVVFLAFVLHTALTYNWESETYLQACFTAGQTFPNTTVTGWIGGLIVFAFRELTTKIGALIIFSLLAIFCGYLAVLCIKSNAPKAASKAKPQKPISAQPQPLPQPSMMQPNGEELATTQMPQTPNVHIPNAPYGQASQGGYSPFARAEQPQQPVQPQPMAYGSKTEYGTTTSPMELLKRNLIFDKTAKVNNREPSSYLPPVQPSSVGTSSYLGDYADYVNENEGNKPAKVVADTYPTAQDEQPPVYESPQQEPPLEPWKLNTPIEPVSPIQPSVEEPFVRTSTFEDTPQSEFPSRDSISFGRDERLFEENDDTRLRGEELFPKVEPTLERERFAPIEEREIPTFNEELREPEKEEPTFPDFTRDRGVEQTSGDRLGFVEQGRDRLSIFDDEEDDRLSIDRSTPTFDSNDRGESIGFGREETLFGGDRSSGFDFTERDNRFDREIMPEPIEEVAPIEPTPEPPKPVEPPKPRKIKPYVPVSLDYFDCRDVVPDANADEVEHIKETIVETLAGFRIYDTTISSVTFGPTVTRYNVVIPRNIPPKKVVSMDQSIAINLQAKEGVNIYPNYEDGAVSIEVPNKKRQFVQLGCMLTGHDFVNAKASSLMFVMGKDVANRKVYGDVCKMTHMLVAGSSNSGKSVFLGSLIISLIYKYSPEELRLILIDPKKTEFVIYQNLPHLIINEIITDVQKTVRCLDWAIREMERRYKLFQEMSMAGTYVVNADEYNAHVEKKEDKLPKIVVIVDELADLMLAAKKEIEDRIQSLTQKARAAGIHLILATQRPSTDVITGVIKSNLPTRIAFAVASEVDSRVILDQTGAHKLLGKGDFLYTMPGVNTPVRVQSAFSSSDESQRVVTFIKMNNEGYYDEKATAFINCVRESGDDSLEDGEEMVEGVYIEALRQIIMRESASISMIQRSCGVGYNKAGKIVEWMEMMGYISKFDGAKARKVLITKAQFEEKYGPL